MPIKCYIVQAFIIILTSSLTLCHQLSLFSSFLLILAPLCAPKPMLILPYFLSAFSDSHIAYSLNSFKSLSQCHHFLSGLFYLSYLCLVLFVFIVRLTCLYVYFMFSTYRKYILLERNFILLIVIYPVPNVVPSTQQLLNYYFWINKWMNK